MNIKHQINRTRHGHGRRGFMGDWNDSEIPQAFCRDAMQCLRSIWQEKKLAEGAIMAFQSLHGGHVSERDMKAGIHSVKNTFTKSAIRKMWNFALAWRV